MSAIFLFFKIARSGALRPTCDTQELMVYQAMKQAVKGTGKTNNAGSSLHEGGMWEPPDC